METIKTNSISNKLNFKLKQNSEQTYSFTIFNIEENITFVFEDLKNFPMKVFELKISLNDLKELDDNFFGFKNAKLFLNGIKKCIESEKYSVKYDENENNIVFEIKNDFFENGNAIIKIPEKEKDLKTQVECLTKMVSELRNQMKELNNNKKNKEEAAVSSFEGTSFLNDEEKKLISNWIHPNKILKFNLLYSTNDGDSSSTFHYYCDGIFPTVTVVLDTSGRRFGGYSTQSWGQSPVGNNYARAPGSFIFNLSNKKKYDLTDKIKGNSVYTVNRHNSYGPSFGGGSDLYLANSSKSSTNNSCSKNSSSSYNTGNNNLLGGTGTTNFQVSYYEVYQVISE